MVENLNYGRKLLLQEFDDFCSIQKFPSSVSVAIIGGSRDDPEVEIIKKYSNIENITVFGIDPDSDEYLDLNMRNNNKKYDEFDFILCSHVLEHIWNIEEFYLANKGMKISNIPLINEQSVPTFLKENLLVSGSWGFKLSSA